MVRFAGTTCKSHARMHALTPQDTRRNPKIIQPAAGAATDFRNIDRHAGDFVRSVSHSHSRRTRDLRLKL